MYNIHKKIADIQNTSQNSEKEPGQNSSAENKPGSLSPPGEIQFGQKYSSQLLRHLQNREEDIVDSTNARAQIMKDMDLPQDRKGVRLNIASSLAELEEKELVELQKSPNAKWAELRGIVLTEAGRMVELPAEDEPGKQP